MRPLVSILIPHFQTPELVRLCLRSIRRYTQGIPFEAIVIDNGSRDGKSLEYLRSVEWIRLIERTEGIGDIELAHKEAIDIGIEQSQAPYVLSFHTDTIPLRADWLTWHVSHLESDMRFAAVGTYKLEMKTPWEQFLQRADRFLRPRKKIRGVGDDHPYIRSHCALYRKEVLKENGISYNDQTRIAAGYSVQCELEQLGYSAKLLSVPETLKRLVHLNHGTMVTVPELGARTRTIHRGQKRMAEFFARPEIAHLLADESLDRERANVQTRVA